MNQEEIKKFLEALKTEKSVRDQVIQSLQDQGNSLDVLSIWIWISLLVVLTVLGGIFLLSSRNQQSREWDHEAVEASRLAHGFWLVIAGLVLTLAVVIVAVNGLGRHGNDISDVIAVITSVSGVVGTLTAAFFGIQAAGAGRNQALQALRSRDDGAGAGGEGAVPVVPAGTAAARFAIDPAVGPHAGGTRVTLTGNGFTGATALNFGTMPADQFEFVNDGMIRTTAPPSQTDTVVVNVVFPHADKHNIEVGRFSYYSMTIVGDTLTIRGVLDDLVAVAFTDGAGQTQEFDTFVRLSPNELSCGVPPGLDDAAISLVFAKAGVRAVTALGPIPTAESATEQPQVEEHHDGCDVVVDEPLLTPDEALPPAEGGIER